jgi:hypothetical protein
MINEESHAMAKKLIPTTLCLITIGILLSQQIKAGKIEQKNSKTTIHVTIVNLPDQSKTDIGTRADIESDKCDII